MNKKAVAAVILAAGESKRMGRPKQLLPWGEATLLDAILDRVEQAGFDLSLLVSGAYHQQVEAIALAHSLTTVFNPEFAAGQSTSLITGLNALPPQTAAVFILADQPYISSRTFDLLIDVYQRTNAPILLPRAIDGRRGNPALFAPCLFPELRQLRGDVGGRVVLRAHEKEIVYVDVDDPGILQDIDTESDYYRLRSD